MGTADRHFRLTFPTHSPPPTAPRECPGSMRPDVITFLTRRLASSILVIVGVATLVFLAVRLVPGDPVESILGEQALAVDKLRLRECLGLDRSLPGQYLAYLGDLLDGTMGRFCDDPNRTVRAEIARVLPATIELALVSLGLAVVVAVPVGVLAAIRQRSWVDHLALLLALLGLSVPGFWLGPMLLILFTLTLKWLPGPGGGVYGLLPLVLPALTLGVALSGRLIRMTRASMLDVMSQNYLVAARARGLR